MLNLGRPTAGPYTPRVVQPLMHLQQHTHTPHSTLALHGCMCTPPPIQKQAMSICVCPLASSRQAGYPLPLPAAFDKAYGSYPSCYPCTHTQQYSKHTRTHQCLPMHLLLGRGSSSFVPGSTVVLSLILYSSYPLFFPSFKLWFSLHLLPTAIYGSPIGS